MVCVSVNNMNIYIYDFEFTNLEKWSHWVAICYYTHICVLLIVILSWIYFNWFMVILRSTTGPYGRSMLEVAYGEILYSLHRGCMELSSGRVVGVSTWCRSCWTYPGQHKCGLTEYYFLDFHTTLNIYIWFSNFSLYKRTLVVSDLVLARRGSENGFRLPICFKHIV